MEELAERLLVFLLSAAWIVSLIEALMNRKALWALLIFCLPPISWVYVFFLPRFYREARQRKEHARRGQARLVKRVRHLEQELARRPPAAPDHAQP